MPIINTSNLAPLGRAWTYEAIASEALVLTNQLDNENVQLYNVRAHINLAISNIVEMLNAANSPWYQIWLTALFEHNDTNPMHSTGLHYIDLSDTSVLSVNTDPYISKFNPSSDIDQILRMNISKNKAVWTAIKDNSFTGISFWSGNLTKKDISELTELQTDKNVQYKQSICWTHSGSDILIFVGKDILTVPMLINRGIDFDAEKGNYAYTTTLDGEIDQAITIVATRHCALDDLLPPDTSVTYRTRIDMPDKYVDLLVKKVQKLILTQLREQVPAQLEQEITQQQMGIMQQISAELQFEQSEREKRKYGNMQKIPGAM
jgi:hypothetical protein